MRKLIVVVPLLLAMAAPCRQAPKEPTCKLQELAIDAALGDPQAQHNLGVEFHSGNNIPKDYVKAATMWRLSSKAGIVESYNNLGYLIYSGKGVAQDYAEGIRLWREAAEKGFAESQVHIGQAYSDGKYLKRDYIDAYAWAKTGKHNSTKMEDGELGKAVEKMADNLLNELKSKLAESEMKEAEARAVEYIGKYSPKGR